jgi:hypothetical protein
MQVQLNFPPHPNYEELVLILTVVLRQLPSFTVEKYHIEILREREEPSIREMSNG